MVNTRQVHCVYAVCLCSSQRAGARVNCRVEISNDLSRPRQACTGMRVDTKRKESEIQSVLNVEP